MEARPRLRLRLPATPETLGATHRCVPKCPKCPHESLRSHPLTFPSLPPPPSTAVPYLTDVKGFSGDAVAKDIFPVSIYASLFFYLIAGPASKRMGLKTFVLCGAACRLWTRMILLWGTSLGAMQLMQVVYAAGTSADAILMAYAYAIVGGEETDERGMNVHSSEGRRYRTVTGALSASHLGSYMLAALFGQVAFDSGASYEALFYVSFVSVGAGCVVGCFLPSAPFDEGPGLSPLHTRTPSTRPPTRTFRDELTRFTKAIGDTVTLVSSRCYGSGVMCVLSGWWVLSSAPPAFLEWYGTSLFDAIDQTHDANGYVVFVARFLMACASVLGGMESFGGTHAANPLLYGGTSGFVSVCAFGMSVSGGVGVAATFYCLALAASQGAAVVVYSQAALAMDALNETPMAGGETKVSSDDAEGGAGEVVAGGNGSRIAGSPDHALLFGANGFLGIFALVLLQAFVDAARVGIRADIAAAAVASLVVAVVTLAAAKVRERWWGLGGWRLDPTGADFGRGEAILDEDADAREMHPDADASALL